MNAPMSTKGIQKRVAVSLWLTISKGVNHPLTCAPSQWLVERMVYNQDGSATATVRELIALGRRALGLRFPGLDRPLGSCYHPSVADLLDVAHHYGAATQRVLNRIAQIAGEVAHRLREGDRMCRHIELCPDLLGRLAELVRAGNAPRINEIALDLVVTSRVVREELEGAERDQQDPFCLVLRSTGIPVTILHRTEGAKVVSERWYDNDHCPNGRTTNIWFHDGDETLVEQTVTEEPHGYFCGGGTRRIQIENATYAFSLDSGRHPNGVGWTKVWTVTVWAGCEPDRLRAALQKALA